MLREQQAEVAADKEGDEESEVESVDEEEIKKNEAVKAMFKLKSLDFWAGNIMASFPHMFADLTLKVVDVKSFNILCKNCRKPMVQEIKRGEKVWCSKQFGYFCMVCLPPTDADICEFLKQVNQNVFQYQSFEGHDRIRRKAVLFTKERPLALKGFVYNN